MNNENIPHNCNTCADYIVCYAYGTLKENENETNCPDWHMDFSLFQDLWEKNTQFTQTENGEIIRNCDK